MGVQSIPFGKNLPSFGDMFLRLKQKGDMVRFKIAQEPVYTGKHFVETEEGGWEVSECPRIASNEECESCNKYFSIMAEVKKLKATGKDDKDPDVKKLRDEARKYSAAIQFYFPILDRADGKFKVLQTTNGVRNKFNAQFENGVEVMEKEWVLRNTGSPSPAERYALSLVDSADVKPFSPEEEEEWKKAKEYDLSQISQGDDTEDL